jgi:hypothetical protein
MMEKPSNIKLESIYIAWCEAIESPSGHGVLPFEAFKEGFRQGVLFGMQLHTGTSASPVEDKTRCPFCEGKLSFGLSDEQWVCIDCGADNKTPPEEEG